jgi:putative effector of murein hydrolase
MELLSVHNLQLTFSLSITIACYFFARQLYIKLNKNILLQPMLVATSLLIILIKAFEIPLDTFKQGTHILTLMIAPLSIGLMVPLAQNFKEIKSIIPAILFTILIGGAFTVTITLVIAYLLDASQISLLSLSSKSVTTPVALVISKEIHALPSLAALIVIITGVIGVMTAPFIFKILKIQDDRAKGISLGLSAHIIGSAFAMEESSNLPKKELKGEKSHNRYAAFSIISMSLTALLSALILPWLIPYFI